MTSATLTATQSGKSLAEALREIPVFADLTEEQIDWLVANGEDMRSTVGTLVGAEGDEAVELVVILEGEMRMQPNTPGADVYFAGAGQVTGMLPFSRLKRYGGNIWATRDSRFYRLHKDLFPEMLQRIPVLGSRLVAVMADRIRETSRQGQEREKLAALGKLSAGLAHELNNPASSVREANTNLRAEVQALGLANHRLTQMGLTPEQSEKIRMFEAHAIDQLHSEIPLGALERSDREDLAAGLLTERGVTNAWHLAPTLVDAGFTVEELREISQKIPQEVLEPVLTRVAATLSIERLLRSIDYSSGQIINLVRSVKEYTYMDQTPVQEIDIHRGIENTLTMLGHRLKHGIEIVRDFDRTMPTVCAWASELNQVWTNLIDNAIDAMPSGGILRIRTAPEINMALIEIADSGTGIPPELHSRVFEPFFTTKEVGKGTGLGLDSAFRIVNKHHGNIRFTSKPGDTVFQVRIPFVQPVVGPPKNDDAAGWSAS